MLKNTPINLFFLEFFTVVCCMMVAMRNKAFSHLFHYLFSTVPVPTYVLVHVSYRNNVMMVSTPVDVIKKIIHFYEYGTVPYTR